MTASDVKVAVFDVDETLLGFKSLFRFAEYYCSSTGLKDFFVFRSEVTRAAEEFGRERANAEFFHLFAGCKQCVIQDYVDAWFRELWSAGIEVVHSGLESMFWHQRNNYEVVWLSGSAHLFLRPFAKLFDVEHVLATELERRDGLLTGNIEGPIMIGQGKAERLARFIHQKNWSLEGSVGYGDHFSDHYFLTLTEQASVIKGDAELCNIARQNGWRLLPSKRLVINFQEDNE